ncbi:MAG TPA: retropepsin-like aspartic protease [Dongiaceae bacterium]|nr:retropepsin-like aspartic protease [Dongiaceae bacterium]
MRTRVWRFAPVLVVSLLLPLGMPAPAADGVPDAAAIRAKILAADGPLPDAFRETAETVTSSGATTVEHRFRRGKDFRTTNNTGRFHTERGSFNGELWHMNDNGQVIVDQPDPGRAAREQTTITVTPVAKPVPGYLIATLNAQGYGAKEYVDGAAWRVVRREQIGVNGTIATTYDDVRADHGRTFAHRAHIENGYAHTSGDMRIVEYVPGDVPPSELAIPPPRRALVTFPPGLTSVELPAKFGRSHVYVRVNVGGRGLDFVLDSGAAGITIDATVARELGLPEYDKRSSVTAGRFTTARTIVPEMRIGPLVMRDVAVQELPHGWQTAPDVKEVGLLGFDFLAELGVTIDYEHERVAVVPSAAYVPPTDPHTIPIDVRVGSGQPRATVSVNGAVGERWILDTGGAGTFLIFDYFARRYPDALRDRGGGDQRERHLIGIGGAIPAKPYQIASLKLANMNFTDWVGYRVEGHGAYAQNDDGVVGVEFLRLFTLGFDYANSRVYLVPNRDGRLAMGIKE